MGGAPPTSAPWTATRQQTPPLGVPRARARADSGAVDPALVSPHGPHYWTPQGAGHPLLAGTALAHVVACMLGVAFGVLAWLILMPGSLLPEVAGGAALLAALAGAVAFELARFSHPGVALGARILLVVADLLVAGILVWLLGIGSFAALFLLVPVVLAALLLSRRAAMVTSALVVAEFTAIGVAQPNFVALGWQSTPTASGTWLPWAMALAGVAALLAYCCAAAAEQAAAGLARAVRWGERLASQRVVLDAEQQRLIEGMRMLEETQDRLTQERAIVNRQALEITRVVERLSEGDTTLATALRPGMYGPLAALSSGLARLGQHISWLQEHQQQAGAQQRTLEAACGGAHEQAQLLTLTDTALRELSASANELVAAIQRLERSGGERFGMDGRALAQALREIEQQALTQASDTAMLGARLAQLRARQSELETSLRHLTRATPETTTGPAAGDREAAAPSGPQAAPRGPRGGEAPVPVGVPAGHRLEPLAGRGSQQANWLM